MKIKMLASSCRESFNCEVSAVSITIRHSEILFTHTDQEMMNGSSFFFLIIVENKSQFVKNWTNKTLIACSDKKIYLKN